MNWPRVAMVLGLTLAPLAAGVALVAIGERDIGLLLLGAGGGAMAKMGADKLPVGRPK